MVGCGEETQVLSKAYPTVADLPACDDSKNGAFVMVEDTGTFHVCDGTAWNPSGSASITVPNVEALPECSDANRGAMALLEDAATMAVCTADGWNLSQTVMFSLFCQGPIDGSLDYEYRNVQISPTGDTWVSASIINPSDQVTSTAVYSWQQEGAANGAVTLVDDWEDDLNYGYWTFTVDVDDEELSIVYNDDDLSSPLSWTVSFDDEECALQAY